MFVFHSKNYYLNVRLISLMVFPDYFSIYSKIVFHYIYSVGDFFLIKSQCVHLEFANLKGM